MSANRLAPPNRSCVYAALEIETAGTTLLVVVFTLLTPFHELVCQFMVEDPQTNRLGLDFLDYLAHYAARFLWSDTDGGSRAHCQPNGGEGGLVSRACGRGASLSPQRERGRWGYSAGPMVESPPTNHVAGFRKLGIVFLARLVRLVEVAPASVGDV